MKKEQDEPLSVDPIVRTKQLKKRRNKYIRKLSVIFSIFIFMVGLVLLIIGTSTNNMPLIIAGVVIWVIDLIPLFIIYVYVWSKTDTSKRKK